MRRTLLSAEKSESFLVLRESYFTLPEILQINNIALALKHLVATTEVRCT